MKKEEEAREERFQNRAALFFSHTVARISVRDAPLLEASFGEVSKSQRPPKVFGSAAVDMDILFATTHEEEQIGSDEER